MMLETASPVEVIQLLFAVVGVGLTFWKLWVAIGNGLSITSSESTDLRRILAETQIIGELFRMFFQGCLVAVGIISVLLPPPMDGVYSPDSLQATLARMGLITLTIAMAADSIVQELRRRQFLDNVRSINAATVTQRPSPDQVMQTDRLDRLEDVRSSKAIKEMATELEAQNERRSQEQLAKIHEGTQAAHAAYEEANTVNIKISNLNERLLGQEQKKDKGAGE